MLLLFAQLSAFVAGDLTSRNSQGKLYVWEDNCQDLQQRPQRLEKKKNAKNVVIVNMN